MEVQFDVRWEYHVPSDISSCQGYIIPGSIGVHFDLLAKVEKESNFHFAIVFPWGLNHDESFLGFAIVIDGGDSKGVSFVCNFDIVGDFLVYAFLNKFQK